MRPLRKTKTFPDHWKLTTSNISGIHPSNQVIADKMVEYMEKTNRHEIRNLERVVMNEYEEQKVMARFDLAGVKFRWRCISKQHCSPFAERYVFAVYSGSRLLAAVFESPNLKGKVVEREGYEP